MKTHPLFDTHLHLPKLAILLAVGCALIPGRVARSAEEQVVLTLPVAALPSHNPEGAHLDFEFKLEDGQWGEQVWVYGMNYHRYGHYFRSLGKGDHPGRVLAIRPLEDGGVELDVSMQFVGGPWTGNATRVQRLGRYTIRIHREGDTFTGEYTGLYDGRRVSGPVSGTTRPIPLESVPGVAALEPGEHPRLIFRDTDLPRLRERANNTPEGQAMMRQLRARLAAGPNWGNDREPARWAAGWGVLHQITEDPEAAEKAREIVERILAGEGQNPRMLQRAPRLMGTALAYDLSHNAWDPAFRRRVASWLENEARGVLDGGGPGLNDHEHSNWMGITFSGAGVAAMAILGDPVAFPGPPEAPGQLRLSPPVDFVAGEGVPVAKLEEGVMPQRWLVAGPFQTLAGDDFLESIGGRAHARPHVGAEVQFGDVTRAFRPTWEFKDGAMWQNQNITGDQPALDLLVPIDRAFHSTSYYYLALENPETGWVKVLANTGAGGDQAVMWLNGERFRPGAVLHLEAGTYPLMIEIALGATTPWGKIMMQPRFYRIDAEAAAREKELADAHYRRELGEWERDHQRWSGQGGGSILAGHLFERAQRGITRYLRTAVGDRGYNIEGEGYLRFTMTTGLLPFLHAQRVAMGQQFAAPIGQDWLLTLPLITGVGPEGNRPAYGPAGWGSRGQQEERSGAFAVGLSNVPAAFLPAARWWYDRVFGLEGGDETFNVFLPDQAGYALMNYPFDHEPANPAGILPKAVLDRHTGYAAFRKQWGETGDGRADPNDLLAVFYAKSFWRGSVHQASNEPTLRIVGFDKRWAQVDKVKVAEPVNNFLGGAVVHADLDPETGNGRLTADISPAYYRRLEKSPDYVETGIEALRAFAVDYSAASGADGLYVLIDQVKNATGHEWILQGSGKASVDGNRFRIERDGYSLTGTVLSPSEAVLSVHRSNILGRGGDTWFVVMTLQKGTEGPQVTHEGEGLGTRATVGARRIHFEDGKLLIEPQH